MADLYPEINAVPMGEGLSQGKDDRKARRRRLEVLLDRVSLLTTDTSTHLLDPTFAGAFTQADLELKREIDAFVAELATDERATSAEAFEEVTRMLTSLGLPVEMLPRR